MNADKYIAEIPLTITAAAINYFERLLTSEKENTNIKIVITNKNSRCADVKVTFCLPGLEEISDFAVLCNNFVIFIEEESLPFLKDAKVDFLIENDEEQLAIKAPNLKSTDNANTTIEEQIECVIENEINPILAAHNGMISLVKVIDGSIALLRFGGGCKGCGIADVTFQQLVENMLRQHFPQLTEIRNVTEHPESIFTTI